MKRPLKFVAVIKHKDGSETVMEYFATQKDCLEWMSFQKQPIKDEFIWCVGEY